MTDHNHMNLARCDELCPLNPAYQGNDRPANEQAVLEKLGGAADTLADAAEALRSKMRADANRGPLGEDKAKGPHLARFYQALGINPHSVGAGAFEVEAYSVDTIIVRYPGQVVVGRNTLIDAIKAMEADR